MASEEEAKHPVDDLAARYMERSAATWERFGFTSAALASAAIVWGLNIATAGEGPENVAAGLERMAAAIREGVSDPLVTLN